MQPAMSTVRSNFGVLAAFAISFSTCWKADRPALAPSYCSETAFDEASRSPFSIQY